MLAIANVNDSFGLTHLIMSFVVCSKAKTAVLVAALDVGFLGAVVLVTSLAVHGSLRVMVIGTICACLNVFMYGSPLAAMVSRILPYSSI